MKLNVKFLCILFFTVVSLSSYGQNLKPRLFINCQQARCYETYLLSELTYFTFTRDQAAADIQILITDLGTASGGRNYELNFIGQQEITGDNYKIEFGISQADTDDIARKKLLNHINLGLLHYIQNSTLTSDVTVTFPKGARTEAQRTSREKDPWNSWIFGLGGNGRFNGESNKKSVYFDANVRGGRTTDKSKYSFYTYMSQNKNEVTLEKPK